MASLRSASCKKTNIVQPGQTCASASMGNQSTQQAKYGLAHEDSPDGIASNRVGLSKLLKAVLSLHVKEPSGKHMCLYFSRSG